MTRSDEERDRDFVSPRREMPDSNESGPKRAEDINCYAVVRVERWVTRSANP
jgi:hypothetical protein